MTFDYDTIHHEDGSVTDAKTGELLVPVYSAEDLESLESCAMTVDECIQECEDMSRAERANEYALEGVTNYFEGSYLEAARQDARAWEAIGASCDNVEPF